MNTLSKNRLSGKIQRMPVPTWEHNGVNKADFLLEASQTNKRAVAELIIPDGISCYESVPSSNDYFRYEKQEYKDIVPFIEKNADSAYHIVIPGSCRTEAPIVINYHIIRENPVLVNDLFIEARENSNATVIIKYTSEDGDDVSHSGRIRFAVNPGARLMLIKAQLLNSRSRHTEFVQGQVMDNGIAEIILSEIGAANPMSSCDVILSGEKASCNMDMLYFGDGTRQLDFTVRLEFAAKKTEGTIVCKGIMKDKSRKKLRDTLDFISGASGAKGREEEHVLMLNPGIRNISVPVLLCGEDDVEGEHAATSGSLEEKTLFYMMSRGISRASAKKLLAEAAFNSILEKIPDQSLREEILCLPMKSIV